MRKPFVGAFWASDGAMQAPGGSGKDDSGAGVPAELAWADEPGEG